MLEKRIVEKTNSISGYCRFFTLENGRPVLWPRELNEVFKPRTFALPKWSDISKIARKAKYLAKIDFLQGYY